MTGRYTADEAAQALGIPRAAIDKWKHRRRVSPVAFIGSLGRPTPLYNIDDLRPLARAYLRRRDRAETRRRNRACLPPPER